MIVGLTEDQTLLHDSIARLMADTYPADTRKALVLSECAHSPEHWQQLADLGALAARFPEDAGGLGLGLTECCVIAQALGAHNFVGPFVSSVILSGGLLAELGGEAVHETIAGVIAGEAHLATAFAERGGRFDLAHCQTTATKQTDGYRLDGRKSVVIWGDLADQLLVLARTQGAASDTDGLSLFLVDPKAQGVTMRGYATNDGHRAAEIEFENVALSESAVLGAPGAAFDALSRHVDRAAVALACEAAGICATLLSSTLDYVGQRAQFGRPIGKFQVVQHAAADMSVETDTLTAMAFAAAQHADMDIAPDQVRRMASTAKAQAGWSGRFVAETALQLHGGVGMSFDLPIGHFLKRISAIQVMFGDPDYHIRRVQALDTAA